MPVTINGNGAISGLGDIDGHDLETTTLVVSGDTTIAPQAVTEHLCLLMTLPTM